MHMCTYVCMPTNIFNSMQETSMKGLKENSNSFSLYEAKYFAMKIEMCF